MDISTFDLTSTIIIVFEGSGTEITIHKQLLCTHCDFAKACLQGLFQEHGVDKFLLKSKEDEDSVRTLLAWMYQEKPRTPTLPSLSSSNSKEKEFLHNLTPKMTKLYIAADKYLMTAFKHEILTFWTRVCRTSVSSTFVLPALKLLSSKQSPANCALKGLLLDRLIRNVRLEQSRKARSHFALYPQSPYNKEFFALTFDHPELASIILQGILQPDIQTEHKGEMGSKKRMRDGDGDECMGLEACEPDAETEVTAKRRRTSSP